MRRALGRVPRSGRAALVLGAVVVLGSGAGWPGHDVPTPRSRGAPDTATTMFDVEGVRVILRHTAANDVVAASLYLLGGTQEVVDSNAGIEALLLEASGYGTRRYSREALRQKLEALGSSITIDPREDWTVFGLRSVTSTFDSTWMLAADRLVHPSLDSSAVELVRAQMLAGAAQRRGDPDALAEYLADSIAFAGHPYAISPLGTERSLRAITRRAVQQFHAQRMMTSRMLLVVVGNIDRARVERLVTGTLGELPHGEYAWQPAKSLGERPAAVVFAQRPLPTNYILGYYEGPASTSTDYQALRIATAVLSGNLFGEIRSRRNLSYAVDAPFLDRALSGGGLYVTTTYPDSVLQLMRQGIATLERARIDPRGLEILVQQFITEYFLNNETNAAQADFLARSQLYRGNFRLAEQFVDELRQVTPDDVRRVAQRYMHRIRFAYVGDSAKVSRASFARFQ